jgi:hypothetical protein
MTTDDGIYIYYHNALQAEAKMTEKKKPRKHPIA